MAKFDEKRIEKTKWGFNYVEVTPYENIKWGGACVCNGCNNDYLDDNMYLVYVLRDTYCEKCFKKWRASYAPDKEDLEYDLKLQEQDSLEWYKYHLDDEFRKEVIKQNKEAERLFEEEMLSLEEYIEGLFNACQQDD